MDHAQFKKLAERRHPLYDAMNPHWEFMESSYLGGRKWFNKDNIFKYLKEGDGEFADRLKRAYRFNHTREVVDLVNKYLFRTSIHRLEDDAPDCVKEFWKSSTVSGLDIGQFARIASTKSSIFGCPWIIVDNNLPIETQGTTEADVKAAKVDGKGIYAYVVSPSNVLDMSYDDQGNLNWILVREMVRDDADPYGEDNGMEERFRLWTRTRWELVQLNTTSVKFEEVDSGVHDLGVVPAIRLDNAFSTDPYDAPALIADIAYLDRACANYASNLDAIIQDQTFSQLAMPAQNVLPGDDAYDALLVAGTKRIFLYDGEGGNAPAFLSPDPRQAQLILSAIGQLINEIYHSVGLAGERTKQDNSKGIDNSSGVAKSKDFERVTALLSSKADGLENAENQLVKLVCLWSGTTPPVEDLVNYSRDFNVRDLLDELDLMMKVSTLQAPEKVMAEQMKNVVSKLFPDLGQDLIETMKSEAEKWAKEAKENSLTEQANSPQQSKLLQEASRNRKSAGQKQSETKDRETDPNQ